MSANCATWTSERIELLKRCLHAGLSCGQTAREIGVTRNAVIGKMNRLGLSRPKDVIARQLEQRRAARLARPRISRTWRSKRPRLNIFAQHDMLMARSGNRNRLLKISLSTTDADARCSSSARGNAAGRSATPAPRTSASAGTSQSKDCPIARGTRALHIGRSAAQQRRCVSIPPQPRPRETDRLTARKSSPGNVGLLQHNPRQSGQRGLASIRSGYLLAAPSSQ